MSAAARPFASGGDRSTLGTATGRGGAIDALLVETTPCATRIASMRGGDLVELRIDRPDGGGRPGDVFAGRVVRVEPAIGAAFVDIGRGETGFLRAREAGPGGAGVPRSVREGERVAVAVETDARDGKGPVLTRRFEDRDGAVAVAAARARRPRLLRRSEPLLIRLARRHGDAAISVDGPADAAVLRRAGRTDGVALHRGAEPLFETAGVEEQIEAALADETRLRSGAVLRFEPVRTLTAVDVDSAGASGRAAAPAAVNFEAAPVLARQLRLRNIGGLIVVDFLNMANRADGPRLASRVADALKDDPAETAVCGPSRFGLVEIARQRLGPTLAEAVGPPARAAMEALVSRLRREAGATVGGAFAIRASPDVVAALRTADRDGAVSRWIGRRLEPVAEPDRRRDDVDVASKP